MQESGWCKRREDVTFPKRGSLTWSVAAMRNRYYATMILQGYSRPTRIFPPVSARLSHLLLRNLAIANDTVWERSDVVYWDTSNSFRCFFLPVCHYIVFVSDITNWEIFQLDLFRVSTTYICTLTIIINLLSLMYKLVE